MAGLESGLASALLGAVAKACVGLWTGNENLTSDAQGDLIGLATKGASQRRRRHARAMAEQVAQALASDFAAVDEGARAAIVAAAEATLAHASLTPERLAAHHLNADALARELIRADTAQRPLLTRDLGQHKRELYERTVTEMVRAVAAAPIARRRRRRRCWPAWRSSVAPPLSS